MGRVETDVTSFLDSLNSTSSLVDYRAMRLIQVFGRPLDSWTTITMNIFPGVTTGTMKACVLGPERTHVFRKDVLVCLLVGWMLLRARPTENREKREKQENSTKKRENWKHK